MEIGWVNVCNFEKVLWKTNFGEIKNIFLVLNKFLSILIFRQRLFDIHLIFIVDCLDRFILNLHFHLIVIVILIRFVLSFDLHLVFVIFIILLLCLIDLLLLRIFNLGLLMKVRIKILSQSVIVLLSYRMIIAWVLKDIRLLLDLKLIL